MHQNPASKMTPGVSDMLPAKEEIIALPSAKANAPSPRPATVSITKSGLPNLVCPAGKSEAFYWDTELSGFALRAYPSGKRVWLLQYRDTAGKTRRVALGSVAAIEPADARKLAKDTLHKVAAGSNPAVDRKAARKAEVISDLIDPYLKHAEQVQKASTFDQTKRNLRKYASTLHGSALLSTDRLAIHRLHQKLGETVGQVQANRVLASLSAMWVWGLKTGLAKGENPCAFVPKSKEVARERVLTADELRLIWIATAEGRDFHRIVRLLMLTACRRQEIGSARWSEIDGDILTVPAFRMKRGKAHEVPLSEFALKQLPVRPPTQYINDRSIFGTGIKGFDGWSAAKRRLDASIALFRGRADGATLSDDLRIRQQQLQSYHLAPWGLHDLRRTFSTMMNENNLADPHVIEAVLAHQGAQAGIAGVYNRSAYRVAKAAALAAWASHLLSIL